MAMQRFKLKWDSRVGPVQLISLKNLKIVIAFFCRRRKDRCIKMFGYRSFLCARCTGTCVCVLLTILLLVLGVTIPPFITFIFIFPFVLDGRSQLIGFRESNNILRLSTGILFSLGLLLFILQVG